MQIFIENLTLHNVKPKHKEKTRPATKIYICAKKVCFVVFIIIANIFPLSYLSPGFVTPRQKVMVWFGWLLLGEIDKGPGENCLVHILLITFGCLGCVANNMDPSKSSWPPP